MAALQADDPQRVGVLAVHLSWTNIIPDATTWPKGDRALHCVAYYSTPKQQGGVTLTYSIKKAQR